MTSKNGKSRKVAKRKAGILGVHPVLATFAAFALLFAGVMGGAWLNATSQPAKNITARSKAASELPPFKPHTAPPEYRLPPKVANIEKAEADALPPDTGSEVAPSITAKPSAVPATVSRELDEDAPVYAFAARFDGSPNEPVIAIVIDDMGLDRVRAQQAVELPGPLTLSFMTYANDLPAWVKRAHAAGHEVMAHMPMEPRDPNERPGPKALTVAMDAGTLDANFAAMLDPWNGYVGVNNHMGSKFTADRARMDVVAAALKSRGLLWLDSKTGGDSVAADAARATGVPTVERDVFLDNVQTEAEVRKELAHAEEIAHTRGTAIAIGHPHDVTLKTLRQWIATLPEKGIALAPVTEVARRQGQLREDGL